MTITTRACSGLEECINYILSVPKAKLVITAPMLDNFQELTLSSLSFGKINALHHVEVILLENFGDLQEFVEHLEVAEYIVFFDVFKGLTYCAQELNKVCHLLFKESRKLETDIVIHELLDIWLQYITNTAPVDKSIETKSIPLGLVLNKWTENEI